MRTNFSAEWKRNMLGTMPPMAGNKLSPEADADFLLGPSPPAAATRVWIFPRAGHPTNVYLIFPSGPIWISMMGSNDTSLIVTTSITRT